MFNNVAVKTREIKSQERIPTKQNSKRKLKKEIRRTGVKLQPEEHHEEGKVKEEKGRLEIFVFSFRVLLPHFKR